MPRRLCGNWTSGEILLHNLSDFFIWTAYLAIPVVLIAFWWRRRNELPFRSLFLLFGMFIIACGTTHLMDIVMFYNPMYRLAGVIKFVTAVVSWATVVALIPAVPRVLAMKSPDALEAEVRARTMELQAANEQKDQLLLAAERARIDAERARAEAEAARQAAENANRAKDEFLMTLSHELRTPLNAIQGWSSLLASGELDEETTQQALTIIGRNTKIQAQLIDDILEVSRIITGKLRLEIAPVPVKAVLENAVSTVETAAAAKQIKLQTEVLDSQATVTGDESRLVQVMWNLLSNAVKFTPRGGQINAILRRQDSFVVLEVRDNGEGIEPQFLPLVFDRFRQADSSMTRQHGGLGLGLAIVRHLTELHGGKIEAFSAGKNQGSTFRVTLPMRAVAAEVTPQEMPASESAAVSHPDNPLQGCRIVVVDDEPEARALVTTILQIHGASIETASNARMALEKIAAFEPALLVSDIGMPGESGYTLIESVRHSFPDKAIKALALTAYASPADKERALTAGFDAHLGKPVLPETLLREVRALLAQTTHQEGQAPAG